MATSFPDFLTRPVDEVAQRLLGCIIEREIDGTIIRVRIVETESYDQDDEASHAYGGERIRNAVMFKKAGYLYVYFTYGMHYCCNVVTGPQGYGSGVLIRAVEPIPGESDREALAILSKNRRGITGVHLTNGPAKLTQALGIDMRFNGHDLHEGPIRLIVGRLRPEETIISSPRIGISKARDLHRRFYIKDSEFVSRKSL